jgi:hypothetical protein
VFPKGDEKTWVSQATIKGMERGWKYLGDVTETVAKQLDTCKSPEEAFLLGMWAMNTSMALKTPTPE